MTFLFALLMVAGGLRDSSAPRLPWEAFYQWHNEEQPKVMNENT